MSSFAVDTAAVTHAASNVSRSISSIRADVHTLMRHLQELQNSWRGEASAEFQAASAQWHSTQAQVEVSLESLGHALGRTADVYLEAEHNIRSAFRR
ncbi:protein of unknown function DUF909 [Jonesia denitrificans DSM 20603]|uniref:ESAT-6-like protein n=2 Tax=Jonesia TaxID=43673 RepID=C7R0W8_JONDD|nr:protein of unknown function DUF909 [Jonesia denitrificans DSM 20603]SQH22232.1 Uncharacterized protein conserved in bacteria [Jonesia denitrificans]